MKESSVSRFDLLSLFLIGITLAIMVVAYPKLPDQVPIHWNTAGEIDGYASRFWGTFMMPAVALGTFVLFKILPSISPRGFKLESSRHTLDIMQTVLVSLFCVIGLATVYIALGYQLDMVKVILTGTGLMLIVVGNVMSKVRKNFFVGIRTPWTLADDEVWALTHRFAGRSFFAGGLLICLVALVKPDPIAILAGAGLAVLLPVVYSFVVYRKLNPDDGGSGGEGRD